MPIEKSKSFFMSNFKQRRSLKNFAFQFLDGTWKLVPAYDLLPDNCFNNTRNAYKWHR